MTSSGGYLTELTLRLAMGAASLSPDVRDVHAEFLKRSQKSDGGFGGREGESDPYYTAFALRSLWILGQIDEAVGQRAGRFLHSRLSAKESIVDLVSLIFASAIVEAATGVVVISDDDDARWRSNVAELLNSLRTDDGGFAKTPEGRAGSTYQTFLNVLCYELLEIEVPQTDSITQFVLSQWHDAGGFLEIRAAKRPGVNPTAAAVGTLKCLGHLDQIDSPAVAEFLADRQTDEGGLAANTRIPFADLLSTCTGLITMVDLMQTGIEWPSEFSVQRVSAYARSMQAAGGGFHGFALDQDVDVEYTFYGVSTLALVQLCQTHDADG